MNQQQATEFVQDALRRGISPEQVSEMLARQLNAPPEVVQRFVARLAAQRAADAAPPPPAVTPAAAPTPENLSPAPSPAAQPSPTPAPPAPVPTASTSTASPTGAARTRRAARSSRAAAASPLNNPELHADIVARLKNNTPENDIILNICERTQVPWAEAQRLVRELALQERRHIRGRNDIIVSSFAGLSVLAGIVMLVAGFLLLQESSTGVIVDMEGLVGSFISGVLLIAGGVIGLLMVQQQRSQ